MIPALLLATALAAAPAATRPARDCVQVSSGSDTHYTPIDDRTILVESQRRWWRLTVTPNSRLRDPSSFLVNVIRGTSLLCTPLDFDLSVDSTPGGFRSPMIVQEFAPITAEEAKALRKAAHR